MSSDNHLIVILNEICAILKKYGHDDFAARLEEQAEILARSGSSLEETAEARKKLHRSVPGMGGLLDLWLSAPTREESISAREELDALCEELYDCTR
jgi:hypothetical protein